MAGRDDLAALREPTALASSAAVSVSDLDLAYQLQLAEAIQASLRLDALASNPSSSKGKAPTALASSAAVSVSDLDLAYQLQLAEAIQASLRLDALASNPSSSKGKAPVAASSSSSSLSQPAPAPPEPSDASYALAIHAADLARAEEDHRYAEACRAYYARAAASACVAAHDAIFARELAAVPEDQWAHDGDNIERPLDSTKPLFRVMFKGMASKEVVGSRDWDPRVAVLAVALCDSQGKVVLRIQKPVEGFVGGRMMLEAMALTEGLQAALGLGIQSIRILNDYKALHNHLLLEGLRSAYAENVLELFTSNIPKMRGIWRPKQAKLAEMIDQVLSVAKKFKQCEISLVERGKLDYVMKLARDSILSQIAKAVAVNASKEKRETCAICLEDTDVSKIHVVEGCAHHFCFCCMKEHVKVKLLHGTLPACPQDGCTTKLTMEGSKIFLSPRLLDIMVQRIREGQIPATQKIYCPYPKCSALMSLSEMKHPLQESSSKYTIADAATLRKCGYEFCYTCGKEWKDKKATCSCPLWDEDNIIRDGMEDDDDDDDDYDEDEDDDYDYDEDEDDYYSLRPII
uniref:RBR-type E3 ubiquitin transferase n=1 Tax=Aegilops tauschii TaxID=37682 RepID=R7W0T5_AEGTA